MLLLDFQVRILDALLRIGVYHCDWKPDNLVLSLDLGKNNFKKYCLKIIDFGGSCTRPLDYCRICSLFFANPEVIRLRRNKLQHQLTEGDCVNGELYQIAMTVLYLLVDQHEQIDVANIKTAQKEKFRGR